MAVSCAIGVPRRRDVDVAEDRLEYDPATGYLYTLGLDGDLAGLVDLADLGELDDARAGVALHHGSSAPEAASIADPGPLAFVAV